MRQNSDDYAGHYFLGSTLLEQGPDGREEAISHLEEALRLNSQSVNSRFLLGKAFAASDLPCPGIPSDFRYPGKRGRPSATRTKPLVQSRLLSLFLFGELHQLPFNLHEGDFNGVVDVLEFRVEKRSIPSDQLANTLLKQNGALEGTSYVALQSLGKGQFHFVIQGAEAPIGTE